MRIHKNCNFQNSFVPILTYDHKSWVVTERVQSQVQASEMKFLRRIERVALFNEMHSSEIRKSLNIELLLLIERSQFKRIGHVSRIPQERLSKQALLAKANGRKRLVGQYITRWTNDFKNLGWNRLGLRPSKMMGVLEDRKVWRPNFELLLSRTSRKSRQ